MAIFNPGDAPGIWEPTPLARGPFAGLQGGAVAGLLTGEIEAHAAESDWGEAASVSAWFFRPVPFATLRTSISPVHQGGRVNVFDNSLWEMGEEAPCAVVRVTLIKARAVEVAGYIPAVDRIIDPTVYPSASQKAPHGGPWFMDAMEARVARAISWFRLSEELIDGAGPLARVVGPADWAHGISRPVSNVVADPNSNLNVHLSRPPRGDWIGVEPQTHWQPELGSGMGGGLLHDRYGVIGRVSMTVMLTSFPKTSSQVS